MHISIRKKIAKDIRAKIGIIIVVTFMLIAILGPFFVKNPYNFSTSYLQPPNMEYIMGTNDLGQDIFSRLIFGMRTSLLVAISAGFLSTAIGAIIGTLSGYIGGIFDRVIMRVVDAFLVIPSIILIILVAAFINPGILTLIIMISIFHWQGGAKIIRGQTLALKQKNHIITAKTFGAKKLYVLLRHVIPDMGNILVVSFIYNSRSAIFLEAGLAFIGIANLTTISLGIIMHNAINFYYLPVWLWWLIPPGLVLSAILLSLTYIGTLLEKIIDPRLRNA
ncbi:MAG: ABC transporter permease [Candidatus Humimicrobiaceae bacterium]